MALRKTSIMELDINTFVLESEADGLRLEVAAAAPSSPKAIVQLVHGMCEHKERYYPLIGYLVSRGFACIIHDHRGHGGSVNSPEDLGYFYEGGYRAAVEDVHLVTRWARKEYPDIPLFLFGHSMGSLIVRTYTKTHDDEISGLIVCGSPSNNPAAGAGKTLARLCGVLAGDRCRPALIQKIAFGSFNSAFPDAKSPNSWVCSDESVVKEYDADPLCSYRFTANGFVNLFSLVQQTYSPKGWRVSYPDLPVHFIAGSEDPCITSPAKFNEAVDFMRRVGYRNVTSHLYPGLRHEIHNEKAKADVWKDIADTIDSWIL
ncbi:MAG: alpha/beta fold hydrolase [Candidatus Cryptobacteroides sp.]